MNPGVQAQYKETSKRSLKSRKKGKKEEREGRMDGRR